MEKDCPRKKKASEEAKKQEAAEKGKEPNKSFKGKQKAKQKAHELSTQEPEAEKSNVAQVGFAGHASALLSSTDHTQWLKSRAFTDWNMDTGATSHMTPHKQTLVSLIFPTYCPHSSSQQLYHLLSRTGVCRVSASDWGYTQVSSCIS
jgi:hypothetical protein